MLRRFSSCAPRTVAATKFSSPESTSSFLPILSSSSVFASSSINNKKKQQQRLQMLLQQQNRKQLELERQKQEMLRQQQYEEETKMFDLRVHQEEMAAYRQHELENTLELVEEDDSAVNILVSKARATKAKMDARESENRGRGEMEEDEDDDLSEEMPFLPSPAPDTLMVQFCDHMQHDQGVKRHAVTITFGSDGFKLASMCKEIRRDLKAQLATSYWQMNQTQERSAFFVCTRISHGTADLLITSMTQRMINYVERYGYRLQSNSVTLSPDVQHTSVRMLYHYFIFRRTDESKLLEAKMREEERMSKMEQILEEEENDVDDDGGEKREQQEEDENDVDNNDEEYVKGQPEFKNFEAPKVGPQEPAPDAKKVSKSERVNKIWKD